MVNKEPDGANRLWVVNQEQKNEQDQRLKD